MMWHEDNNSLPSQRGEDGSTARNARGDHSGKLAHARVAFRAGSRASVLRTSLLSLALT